QRYSETLRVQDVLASADKGGQALFLTLIGPARDFVKKDAKVFVIPDGRLNNVNFETLLVSDADAPGPKMHYWIEDVTIANASSLRVLAATHAGNEKRNRSLLLVGDSVAPNDEYRELPQAAAQMKSVASHFSAGDQKLRADLVTISACYSAGERAYSGEGLVGLSWAFLAAGARNVVAALWDVSDASTAQLMDKFYDELNQGASADAALRAAKLSLLRGKDFHSPFYWAPFQLYARLG